MTIFEYYLKQQQYPEWKEKFQSTSDGKSGKLFPYTSTNYRGIKSFFTQLDKFKNINATNRSEWKRVSKTGQEKDKHRITHLMNANFIELRIDTYYLTSEGYTCIDLIDLEANNIDKWILLYFLLLNYDSDKNDKSDVLSVSLDILKTLKYYYTFEKIMKELKKVFEVKSINELIDLDVFWLLSFNKDRQFLDYYCNSNENDKNELKHYVKKEIKNKETEDCIAHKYIPGGAFNKTMFVDEAMVLYISLFVLSNNIESYNEFEKAVIDTYCCSIEGAHRVEIEKFFNSHKSIYKRIFDSKVKGVIDNE